MDISQLPESERQQMIKSIEEKQAKQFMNLYNTIVNKCFNDCVNGFTSEALSGEEKECLKKCTLKHLRVTNRIGQQMAEKQMMPPPTSTSTITTKADGSKI